MQIQICRENNTYNEKNRITNKHKTNYLKLKRGDSDSTKETPRN